MGFIDRFLGNKITRLDEPTDTQVMTYRASDQSWGPAAAASGAGAVVREGGTTTEVTTTSTTATNLLSVASLTIAAAEPASFKVMGRKTTGAAVDVGLGWTANATVMTEAVAGEVLRIGRCNNTANVAENFSSQVDLVGRVTNYTNTPGVCVVFNFAGTDHGHAFKTDVALTVQITDLIIRGITGNALVACGADELQIYSWTSS